MANSLRNALERDLVYMAEECGTKDTKENPGCAICPQMHFSNNRQHFLFDAMTPFVSFFANF